MVREPDEWRESGWVPFSQPELPANLREITIQRLPDDVVINPVVPVRGQVPGTSDASPGHLRMRLLEGLGETADRLTDPGYDRFPSEPEGDVRVIGRAGP